MLARLALRNDKFVVFVVLVLALLGCWAYVSTPSSIFPTIDFARIDVVVDAGDLPPDRINIAVAVPLERALQTLPSATNVVATASQGSAEFLVDFSAQTSPQAALQNVERALAQIRPVVPAAKNITAQLVNPNLEPIVSYALTSFDLSQAVLRQIAVTQIVPRLYGTPGLGEMHVTGGGAIEYHVALDAARLAALGLGAADVAQTLASSSDVREVGRTQRDDQEFTVLVDSSLHDRASLESVLVPTKAAGAVPLASLGSVSLGVAPVTNQTSLNGRHAVFLSAYVANGTDTVRMARALRPRIAALATALPRNVAIAPFWDQTSLVVASQAALRDAIALGALLAIVVIFAFLRNVRLTLVAAAVIPLAMAITLLALKFTGQTLNLMSVGGLAVAVGLIIDDAIVVIESIARNRHEHPELGNEAAIERSMRALGGAMVASTASTVVVFVPLSLLGGVSGFFFRALALTLSIALIVSLGLALTIAPILARTFLRAGGAAEREHDAMSTWLARYDGVLRFALGRRAIVAVAAVAVMLVTIGLLTALPSDFLPKMDEGQFEIGYTMPVGTALAASDAAALAMARVVGADPAVASVATLSGVDSNGVSPTQPNQGALRVRLKPPGDRDGYDAVSERLRSQLSGAVPAALLDFRQILEDIVNDISGSRSPIEITLHGDDQQTLVGLGERVAATISRVPGVVDAASGVTYDGPSIRVAPRGAALAALGSSAGDVGDALSALGQGTVATALPGAQTLVPVRVAIATDRAAGSAFDASAPLYLGGRATALGDIATLATRRRSTDIVTQNGRPIDRVTANFEGTSLSAVTADIASALASTSLPPGYSAEIGGQAQSQASSFSEFTRVIGLAVLLVFTILLASFRSFRIPLVILTAVPLALIGVAVSLFVTRTAFNVSSFMGLLLLVGVVVKNGILLIDVANRRRAEGANVRDALVDAGKTRVRPIVMTTLAAIGGLLPLAIGFGQGAEMEKPLAIAVIGGLSTATIFTLIVIPVIYATFFGDSRKRSVRGIASTAALAFVIAAGAAQPAHAQDAIDPLVFSALPLEAASRAALANSTDVAAARARVEASRAALAGARSGYSPSFVANYAQVPQGNPPGPNVISREGSALVQWSLGDVLGVDSAVREGAFALAAAQADERVAETAERIKVCALYYDALKARAVATAGRDALDLARAERDAARIRLQAGDVARLDVIRSDVAVAKAEAALELDGATDENASDALRTETGLSGDVLVATRPIGMRGDALAPIDPNLAVSLARAARPEIASAERTADAARAALQAARAARFPALTVGAGYLIGTDSAEPVSAPTVVANFTLPLGAGARDRVAAANARTLEARANALGTERRILLDVAAAARTLAASQRAAAATTRERESARDESHATELGYRSGASSSLEVASARTAYTQAVVDDVSARYALAKSLATLEIEIGR